MVGGGRLPHPDGQIPDGMHSQRLLCEITLAPQRSCCPYMFCTRSSTKFRRGCVLLGVARTYNDTAH
jgi:hypothetical protein